MMAEKYLDLSFIRRVFFIASLILLLSGFMDFIAYLLSGFHAPAWVLGASWIAMGLILLAVERTLTETTR